MNSTESRETLTEIFVANGTDRGIVENIVASLDDAGVEQTLADIRDAALATTALRDRLDGDPVLAAAVLPAADWKDDPARLDVAKGAIMRIEAAADKAGLTVADLAQALIDGHGTIADTIATHGGDPRTDGFGTGNFYAFRWRLRDAVDMVEGPVRERERMAREAARDAAWEAEGKTRCEHCGGVGGARHWPGYTCYKCDGYGAA